MQANIGMKNFVHHIRQSISDVINAYRFLIIELDQENAVLTQLVYVPRTGVVKTKKKIRREKSPFTLAEKKITKAFFSVLFFPFSYHVVCIADRSYAQSSYFTITIPRKNPQKDLEPSEITSTLSKEMLAHLDVQKQSMITQYNYDDVRVVLVDNKVVQAQVDTTRIFPKVEEIFQHTGKRLSLGMVQTLMHRDVFEKLHTILPKRAKISLCAQKNFNIALSLYLTQLPAQRIISLKKFLFAKINERETELYICNGQDIFFYDSFRFGWRSLYEAIHHALGIELDTFRTLITGMAKKEFSRHALSNIEKILDVEIQRFLHGIGLFQKQTSIKQVFVDGGVIERYLQNHKKTSKLCITGSEYLFGKKLIYDAIHSHTRKGDIMMEIHTIHKNILTIAANRMIRWLLPHHMDVS